MRSLGIAALLASLVSMSAEAQTTVSGPGLLVTRAELTAAASQAEAAATTGQPDKRAENAMIAAAIHQRLNDGDLHVGDRVVVTVVSDVVRRDTVVVRTGRVLELPGMIIVPVAGVLRSELRDRIATEVLKYVKAQQVEATALIRVGVLGAVARPGYFAFASDIPLTDAIMGAGGPTGGSRIERSFVRRQNQEYRSTGETSKAIASGLTLDQFGLSAGDELVVGQPRAIGAGTIFGWIGALASVLGVALALRK